MCLRTPQTLEIYSMIFDPDEDVSIDVADAIIIIFAAVFEAWQTQKTVEITVLTSSMERLLTQILEDMALHVPESCLVQVVRETLH